MNVEATNIPEEAPIAKPRQVQTALYLLYAYLVFFVVGSIFAGFQASQLSGVSSLGNQIFCWVAFLPIYLILLTQISIGKSWSRLFVLIGLLFVNYSLYIVMSSTFMKVFMTLGGILGLTAIVLLYLKPSQMWFDSFNISYEDVKSYSIPKPSRSQVLSKLKQYFPDEEEYQEAKELLDSHIDTERLQAAIIKVSSGDMEKFKNAFDLDWREVLTSAEVPIDEYMDWLNSE